MQAGPTFLAAIALLVVGLPTAVQAEQPKRIPQIGYLNQVARADYDPAAKDPFKDAVLEGLKALGNRLLKGGAAQRRGFLWSP
jgi:hypothetical protein